MGRPPARAPGALGTSERILRAAEPAFAEHGFEGARLADIAKEAGIRRPSLLHHYKTKHDLYCAVVEGTFEALGAALAGPLGDGELGFEARVEAVFVAFSAFLDDRPGAARIVLRELLDGRGPGQAILQRTAVPLLERVEAFLEGEGGERLRPGLPVRAALLSVVLTRFVRSAAEDPLKSALFAPEADTLALLRLTFFSS